MLAGCGGADVWIGCRVLLGRGASSVEYPRSKVVDIGTDNCLIVLVECMSVERTDGLCRA